MGFLPTDDMKTPAHSLPPPHPTHGRRWVKNYGGDGTRKKNPEHFFCSVIYECLQHALLNWIKLARVCKQRHMFVIGQYNGVAV